MTLTFDPMKTSEPGQEMTSERAHTLLKALLVKRFPLEIERQVVLPRGDRFNFCCPYCGDSTDARKKRGNMYLESFYFKCYNGGCEKRVNFIRMLGDYQLDHLLTDGEKVGLRLAIAKANETSVFSMTRAQQDVRMSALLGSNLAEMLVPRRELTAALSLLEIKDGTPIGNYLRKRQQPFGQRFMWDQRGKRLFILNLDTSGEFVFGLQTRQFAENASSSAKYMTYDVTYLWSKFMRKTDAAFLEKCQTLDKVSTLFGILTVDLALPVTAFEGPMDSFLFPNSVATCSINNELPFQIDSIRWFQDNDAAGKKKAVYRCQNGESVFLWRKFLEARGMASQKVKDFNDLVTLQAATGKDLGLTPDALSEFFSQGALDIINI